MEDLDNLYSKLQIYLMKKDDECGKLRFLTSSTTEENSKNVQEIRDAVGEILKTCGIPTGENASAEDPKCVETYKYLVLNTNFDSQEMLSEDPLNGYLVDMCPPLSPYLLIEVLWSLGYEEILARSIPYVPLDLAVELIEIAKRCLPLLDFSRGLNFLFSLTVNSYKTLRCIAQNGAITVKLNESLERLMIYCQDLMSLFLNENFTRINEVAGIKKSERHGLIMKMMIKLTRECLDCAKKGVDLSSEETFTYKLTFGREPYTLPNENFGGQLNMLDQEFVHNLLKKGCDIDVLTYLDWASLEDSGESKLSFQQSLGIDCYHFIEFIKDHDNLIKLDNLVENLQQISSKPGAPGADDSNVDIKKLQQGLIDGKAECLKVLLKHNRKWNHEIFDLVRKHHALMDKEDFLNLLEYLTHVMTKEGQEEHKREVYTTVTKVLLQQDIKDVYETVVDYILRHDARNILESSYTEDVFRNFMSHNKNFKSSTNLRLLLFFLVKNPRKFLAILLQMCIGHPDYNNIMITPSDFMLLSPILSIREKQEESLVLSTLRNVCIENKEWNSKKFSHLVKAMLDEYVLNVNELVNRVFIPYIDEGSNQLGNLICVLNCLRINIAKCSKDTDFEALLAAIAKKMSSIRSDVKLRKSLTSQALSLMTRVINLFAETQLGELSEIAKLELIEKVEKPLRPIDKQHVTALLFSDTTQRSNVFDTIIRDYEQRCFRVFTKFHQNHVVAWDPGDENLRLFRSDKLQEAFICHLILTSTEIEYVRLACDATIFQWEFLRCENEYLAYEKLVRLTIEACVFCLEFPQANSPDTFPTLLKKLTRFTSKFLNLQNVCLEKIDQGLTEHFRELDKSIHKTIFSSLYANVIVEINNRDPREPINENLQSVLIMIDNFANKCLEVPHAEVKFTEELSPEVKRFKVAYDFIQEATSPAHADDNYSALSKIFKLLYSCVTND